MKYALILAALLLTFANPAHADTMGEIQSLASTHGLNKAKLEQQLKMNFVKDKALSTKYFTVYNGNPRGASIWRTGQLRLPTGKGAMGSGVLLLTLNPEDSIKAAEIEKVYKNAAFKLTPAPDGSGDRLKGMQYTDHGKLTFTASAEGEDLQSVVFTPN